MSISQQTGRPVLRDPGDDSVPPMSADERATLPQISAPGKRKPAVGEPDVDDLVDRLKRAGVHLAPGTNRANFMGRLEIALHALEGHAGQSEEAEIQRKIATLGPRKPVARASR